MVEGPTQDVAQATLVEVGAHTAQEAVPHMVDSLAAGGHKVLVEDRSQVADVRSRVADVHNLVGVVHNHTDGRNQVCDQVADARKDHVVGHANMEQLHKHFHLVDDHKGHVNMGHVSKGHTSKDHVRTAAAVAHWDSLAVHWNGLDSLEVDSH